MGRVAIIDDSVDALDLFEVILRGEHEFVTFNNPEDFLANFREGVFDLILLDLVMPRMDGFTVFESIRDRDKGVPVVAISAKAYPAEREKALSAGFCDYFVKPIMEIEFFREAVYKHVGRCANPPFEKSA